MEKGGLTPPNMTKPAGSAYDNSYCLLNLKENK